MAAASEKVCVNCLSYGWGQPSVPSDMKHCGQCKIFDYCGVDCQREHWLKVHKKHCKYLAEKKVLAMSVHDEATCLVCKMGTEAATNLKDRVLPCTMSAATLAHMRIVVDTASPGLSLAEMTGKFHTKEEATLTQMMRLVTKMSLLEHEKECCDYCGQAYRGRVGHRCSRCLTKLYCGEECRDQDQDWGVHKLSCKEGEED